MNCDVFIVLPPIIGGEVSKWERTRRRLRRRALSVSDFSVGDRVRRLLPIPRLSGMPVSVCRALGTVGLLLGRRVPRLIRCARWQAPQHDLQAPLERRRATSDDVKERRLFG